MNGSLSEVSIFASSLCRILVIVNQIFFYCSVDEDSKKRKRSTGDQDGPASKRQKTDTGEAIPDVSELNLSFLIIIYFI